MMHFYHCAMYLLQRGCKSKLLPLLYLLMFLDIVYNECNQMPSINRKCLHLYRTRYFQNWWNISMTKKNWKQFWRSCFTCFSELVPTLENPRDIYIQSQLSAWWMIDWRFFRLDIAKSRGETAIFPKLY